MALQTVTTTGSASFMPGLSSTRTPSPEDEHLNDSSVHLEEANGVDDVKGKSLYHHVLFLSAVCSGQMMVVSAFMILLFVYHYVTIYL